MKRQILWLAIDAVFLIVFNVCFYVLVGGMHGQGLDALPPSVWVSYGFIHLSYFLLLSTPLFVQRGNKAVADYARPLYAGTWIYFLVSLVVNVAFILVSLNSAMVQLFEQLQLAPQHGLLAWIVRSLVDADGLTAAWLLKLLGSPVSSVCAWVVNVVLLGAALVYLLANGLVNADTAAQQERHERELHYVKTAASRIKAMVDAATDKRSEAELEKLYYAVNSSPLRSCGAAHSVEQQLLAMLDDLEDSPDAATTERLCKEMVRLANRRNRIVSEHE